MVVPGAVGADRVAVVKSGEGDGQGGSWGFTELKLASRLLPELFSTVIMLKRSRPEDGAVGRPSEGAKGSLGRRCGWRDDGEGDVRERMGRLEPAERRG